MKLPGIGPRHFTFHPNGVFGYAIGEKSSSIVTMRWDGQRGILTPIQTMSTLPPDFHGPNGAAEVLVHPNGRFLYGSNRGDESIAVFTIDPDKGTVEPVQFVPTQGKQPSNILIDPSGKYLMVANVFSSNLVQFQIDQQTGRLISTGFNFAVPFPAGMQFAPAR